MRLGGAAGITLALLAGARPATADSDGHYCATPAYLAYELRGFTSGPDGKPSAEHRLWLVTARAGAEPASIVLPDFQVHGMRCSERRVELAGWDSVHVVELGARHEMLLAAAVRSERPGSELPGFAATNLGQFAPSVNAGEPTARVDLPLRDGPVAYVLEVRHRAERCRHHVETYLMRRDGGGEPRLLAAADFERDCH